MSLRLHVPRRRAAKPQARSDDEAKHLDGPMLHSQFTSCRARARGSVARCTDISPSFSGRRGHRRGASRQRDGRPRPGPPRHRARHLRRRTVFRQDRRQRRPKLQQSFEFKATPGFINAINADPDVQGVVHVGDIHSGQETCREDYDRAIFDLWKSYEDPLVYMPGDNEWSDCSKLPGQAPATNPWTNLLLVRSIFFPARLHARAEPDEGHLSGRRGRARQRRRQRQRLRRERHLRQGRHAVRDAEHPGWLQQRRGSVEPLGRHDGGLQQLAERTQRTQADLDWLDRSFATARREHDIKQVVIIEQADMWDTADSANPAHLAELRAIRQKHRRAHHRARQARAADQRRHARVQVRQPLLGNGDPGPPPGLRRTEPAPPRRAGQRPGDGVAEAQTSTRAPITAAPRHRSGRSAGRASRTATRTESEDRSPEAP